MPLHKTYVSHKFKYEFLISNFKHLLFQQLHAMSFLCSRICFLSNQKIRNTASSYQGQCGTWDTGTAPRNLKRRTSGK